MLYYSFDNVTGIKRAEKAEKEGGRKRERRGRKKRMKEKKGR